MLKPQFKECFHVEVVEPDITFLLTEGSYRILTGRGYHHLAPLLNGQHTTPEIIARLAGKASPPEVYYMLHQLAAGGMVVEAHEAVPPATAAYWHILGGDTAQAHGRLQQTTISLHAVGEGDPHPLQRALAALGVSLAAEGEEGELLVVVTDDYLRPELADINREALAAGRPWMVCKLAGVTPWIGPLFMPGETACWECLATRLRGNRQVESYIQKKQERTTPVIPPRASLVTTIATAANLAATEIFKWVSQVNGRQLHNQLLTYDSAAAQLEKHTLIRRPQCTACGDPAYLQSYRTPRPVVLQPAPRQASNDGGYRTALPEETLARQQKHVSPITGVVSSLEPLFTQANGIIYSYAAGHNFAMTQDDMTMLRRNLRARSGGKGITDTQARVSAIGEAMERYSGVFRGDDEMTLAASYRQLGDSAIHLHDLLLFSEKQYAGRHEWNKQRTTNFHLVPNPFDEEQVIDWTPTWSLIDQTFKYVPTAYCYFGHPDLKYFYCGSDSNGCSAGNTLEEAILQGFLELVERDAVALWWYNRVRRPALDLDSFDLPYCGQVRDFYQQHHRTLEVLDISADLGIPVFAAISGRTDKAAEDIIIGFGAHPSPQIALMRALSELNQLLSSVWYTHRDGNTHYFVNDQETLDWFTKARMAEQTYLTPAADLPARQLSDFAYQPLDDITAEIERCLGILRGKGLDMLVLDMTRPDVGMNVCRVMVPGLRHFWRRLGPGRLYDVPVQLGWLPAPIPEEELNPISMFF